MWTTIKNDTHPVILSLNDLLGKFGFYCDMSKVKEIDAIIFKNNLYISIEHVAEYLNSIDMKISDVQLIGQKVKALAFRNKIDFYNLDEVEDRLKEISDSMSMQLAFPKKAPNWRRNNLG